LPLQFIESEALGGLPTFEPMFSLVAECVKHFEYPLIGYSDHSSLHLCHLIRACLVLFNGPVEAVSWERLLKRFPVQAIESALPLC
jgi:muramoyltetrapeptide carboxypeptidase LdcA involved in peptidoglycan recycling